MSHPSTSTDRNVPQRVTGIGGLAGLAIGIVVGSGIFKVPGTVFEAAGEHPAIALAILACRRPDCAHRSPHNR